MTKVNAGPRISILLTSVKSAAQQSKAMSVLWKKWGCFAGSIAVMAIRTSPTCSICALMKKNTNSHQRVGQELPRVRSCPRWGRSCPRWGRSCPGVGQELPEGVGQELPPESVTLLNQSMNQSMNLILLAHRLKPLSRHALVSRIIHLNLKLPGRHIQNVLVAILSLQPGKHGRPVSVRALNPLTCWQAYSAMQDTSLPLGKPGLST